MTNGKRIGSLQNSLASDSEPIRLILRVPSRLAATTYEIMTHGRDSNRTIGKPRNMRNKRRRGIISASVPRIPHFPYLVVPKEPRPDCSQALSDVRCIRREVRVERHRRYEKLFAGEW